MATIEYTGEIVEGGKQYLTLSLKKDGSVLRKIRIGEFIGLIGNTKQIRLPFCTKEGTKIQFTVRVSDDVYLLDTSQLFGLYSTGLLIDGLKKFVQDNYPTFSSSIIYNPLRITSDPLYLDPRQWGYFVKDFNFRQIPFTYQDTNPLQLFICCMATISKDFGTKWVEYVKGHIEDLASNYNIATEATCQEVTIPADIATVVVIKYWATLGKNTDSVQNTQAYLEKRFSAIGAAIGSSTILEPNKVSLNYKIFTEQLRRCSSLTSFLASMIFDNKPESEVTRKIFEYLTITSEWTGMAIFHCTYTALYEDAYNAAIEVYAPESELKMFDEMVTNIKQKIDNQVGSRGKMGYIWFYQADLLKPNSGYKVLAKLCAGIAVAKGETTWSNVKTKADIKFRNLLEYYNVKLEEAEQTSGKWQYLTSRHLEPTNDQKTRFSTKIQNTRLN